MRCSGIDSLFEENYDEPYSHQCTYGCVREGHSLPHPIVVTPNRVSAPPLSAEAHGRYSSQQHKAGGIGSWRRINGCPVHASGPGGELLEASSRNARRPMHHRTRNIGQSTSGRRTHCTAPASSLVAHRVSASPAITEASSWADGSTAILIHRPCHRVLSRSRWIDPLFRPPAGSRGRTPACKWLIEVA